MKECNVFRESKHTLTPPTYFQGCRDPNPSIPCEDIWRLRLSSDADNVHLTNVCIIIIIYYYYYVRPCTNQLPLSHRARVELRTLYAELTLCLRRPT